MDGDGFVGFRDFSVLARNFGAVDATFAQGDFDGDGRVGWSDFLVLARNFGKRLPG